MGKFIVSIVNYFFCDSLLFIYGGILAFDSRDGEMQDTQQKLNGNNNLLDYTHVA